MHQPTDADDESINDVPTGVHIDPTAHVQYPGLIGYTTIIGAGARLTGYVRIWGAGDGLPTRIDPNVTIIGGTSRLTETTIGEHVHLGTGVHIESGATVAIRAIVGEHASIGHGAVIVGDTIIPPGLHVPPQVQVVGRLTSRERRDLARLARRDGNQPGRIVTVAELLGTTAPAEPQPVRQAGGGAYERDEQGVWRYAITSLRGQPVPGAQDVTLADLVGEVVPATPVFPHHEDPTTVLVPLLPTVAHRQWFTWADQFAQARTHRDKSGRRTTCRVVEDAAWRQVAGVVVDIVAPELSPAALLTTEQAAQRAATTPEALTRTAQRDPRQIAPVGGSARRYLWSAPLMVAYARDRRARGRPPADPSSTHQQTARHGADDTGITSAETRNTR